VKVKQMLEIKIDRHQVRNEIQTAIKPMLAVWFCNAVRSKLDAIQMSEPGISLRSFDDAWMASVRRIAKNKVNERYHGNEIFRPLPENAQAAISSMLMFVDATIDKLAEQIAEEMVQEIEGSLTSTAAKSGREFI